MTRPLFLFLFLLVPAQITSYSIVPKRRSLLDRKTGRLFEHQKHQPANHVPEGVKHHTYREEMPGKNRQGTWFLKPQHKTKQQSKKQKSASGRRQIAYGKVSWW
jgi:hypothetical protein